MTLAQLSGLQPFASDSTSNDSLKVYRRRNPGTPACNCSPSRFALRNPSASPGSQRLRPFRRPCTASISWLGSPQLSAEGEWVSPLQQVNSNIFAAMLLVHLAVLVLSAIALTASTRLPTPATLAVTVGTLFSGILAGSWGNGETWSRFVPDLQRLWISDGLIRGGDVSWPHWGGLRVGTLDDSRYARIGCCALERRDVG